MTFQPNLAYRFWRALGFRHGVHAERPDDENATYTVHTTVSYWDWQDRLLILISGTTATELCIETERLEQMKGVRTQAAVLAPGVRKAHYPKLGTKNV